MAAAAAPPTTAGAGQLLRVSHAVENVESTAEFYAKCLGLERSEAGGAVRLSAAGGEGLCLELAERAGGAFEADAGYQGVSARVPSVKAAVEAAVAAGGTVLRETAEIEHAASLVPEEPDEQSNIVVEALVADPSGYPLLLHECAEVESTILSGARVDVHVWKESQEWYESLGWSTLRWNANVHREASLTVTMGPAAEGMVVGPRGALPPSSAPVLQLTYNYNCKPIEQAADGGLGVLVLAAADGADAAELSDPDAYKVVLE